MKMDFLNAPIAGPSLAGKIPDSLIIIARWESESDRKIIIQDFVNGGMNFIPVFSDWISFKEQVAGSGFEEEGLQIDRKLFASILRGNENIVLNPGGASPVTLQKSDIEG